MKPDREEFCKTAFENYLVQNVGTTSPVWSRVPKGQDPPDYYLELGTEAFAVEVTSTEVIREASIGEGGVREETYVASHSAFVKELESMAIESGFLRGVYILTFRHPLASIHFAQVKANVLKQLLSFLRSTQELSSSSEEVIYYDNEAVCWISKLQARPNAVYDIFEDGAWTESQEFRHLVSCILVKALSDKKHKLQKKGESLPAILLLLNTYPLANAATYCSCFQSNAENEFFHSVFLVNGNGSGNMLYSRCNEWCCERRKKGAA